MKSLIFIVGLISSLSLFGSTEIGNCLIQDTRTAIFLIQKLMTLKMLLNAKRAEEIPQLNLFSQESDKAPNPPQFDCYAITSDLKQVKKSPQKLGRRNCIKYCLEQSQFNFCRWKGEVLVSTFHNQPKLKLSWSHAGAIYGQECLQVKEPSDPHTWHDNFLCTNKPIGMRWSHTGSIQGMNCTPSTNLQTQELGMIIFSVFHKTLVSLLLGAITENEAVNVFNS